MRVVETGMRLSMDALTAFGLFAVTAMLVCYALEDRSHWFVLAFAAACALGSAYGFLQGVAVRSGRSDMGACGFATLAKPFAWCDVMPCAIGRVSAP